MLQHQRLDALFHALADPGRRDMVEVLAVAPRTVGELAERHAISLSAAGQHVRILERGGLVATRKVGRSRLCTLADDGVLVLQRWAEERRLALQARLDRLAAHLGEES